MEIEAAVFRKVREPLTIERMPIEDKWVTSAGSRNGA